MYGDAAFKVGEAFGRKATEDEWRRRFGWRAHMSGGGVACLSLSLLALGLVAGRLSSLASESFTLPSSLASLGGVSGGAEGRGIMARGMAGVIAVMDVIVAAGGAAAVAGSGVAVALYDAAKDKFGGGGGGGGGRGDSMTVHLPSAAQGQEGGGDNYHGL